MDKNKKKQIMMRTFQKINILQNLYYLPDNT